jgi:hypothetical protein
MTPPPYAYCTDEDVSLRSPADWAAIVPRDQAIVRGTVGVIAEFAPWILSQQSTVWESYGITRGQIAHLVKPTTSFKAPGELAAVEMISQSPYGLRLRRRGLLVNEGEPFGPSPNESIEFNILTLRPQIQRASADLDRQFGVNDFFVGRRHSDLFDPTELRDATVLLVLSRLYREQSRGTAVPGLTTPSNDVWGAKATAFKAEFDEVVARASVHWYPTQGNGAAAEVGVVTRNAMRLSR